MTTYRRRHSWLPTEGDTHDYSYLQKETLMTTYRRRHSWLPTEGDTHDYLQKETLMTTYSSPYRRRHSWLPTLTNGKTCGNAALRTATGCTRTYNICITKYSYFPYASYYNSTRHNTNRKHDIQHTPYTYTQHTSTLSNGCYTTNIPTVTTTDIKTNMRHIHASIFSRHLATRGNRKILRTPPPHITALKRYFPASLVSPLPNSEQINHPSANHTYTNSTPNHIHHHYSPSVTLHTQQHHLFYCTHIRTRLSPLELWIDPAGVIALLARWTEKLAGGPQAGRSDSTPPPQ